jgi:hypothetical protein
MRVIFQTFICLLVFHKSLSSTSSSVNSKFDPWFGIQGMLSGFDIPSLPPAIMNISTAELICSSNDDCFGYSFNSTIPNPDPSQMFLCVFRSTTFTGGESDWYSFARCGVYTPCPPQPSCQKGEWASASGYLAANGDVIAPDSSISLADAKKKCSSTINCLGITFSGPSGEPEGLIPLVYYKNQTDFSAASGWWTWLLCLS